MPATLYVESTVGRGAPFAQRATVDQHARCAALSSVVRGKLCEQLAIRPARHLRAGQFLYFAGEQARSLYFVKSGLVKTTRTSRTGDELILQLHQPGDILGELCFCSAERREEAMAVESSEVVEILLVDLLGHLRRNPETALDLIAALSERLGAVHDRLQSLAFEPTMERLARTLLMLVDTLGEVAPDGTHIAHYVRQEELAHMIGARREVVSGLLNRLRERGLIQYSRKGPISVRRDALQQYVDALSRERGK